MLFFYLAHITLLVFNLLVVFLVPLLPVNDCDVNCMFIGSCTSDLDLDVRSGVDKTWINLKSKRDEDEDDA